MVYFTESGLIIGFILLGNTMEHIVKGRTSESVRKLLDLQPKMATVLRDGREVEMPVEQVEVGDLLVVRPGGNSIRPRDAWNPAGLRDTLLHAYHRGRYRWAKAGPTT